MKWMIVYYILMAPGVGGLFQQWEEWEQSRSSPVVLFSSYEGCMKQITQGDVKILTQESKGRIKAECKEATEQLVRGRYVLPYVSDGATAYEIIEREVQERNRKARQEKEDRERVETRIKDENRSYHEFLATAARRKGYAVISNNISVTFYDGVPPSDLKLKSGQPLCGGNEPCTVLAPFSAGQAPPIDNSEPPFDVNQFDLQHRGRSVRIYNQSGPVITAKTLSTINASVMKTARRCWNINAGLKEATKLIVKVEFKLSQNGRLIGEPHVVNSGRGPQFEDAANSAKRALIECQPYTDVPSDLYFGGIPMVLTFDPSERHRAGQSLGEWLR
jgi:hypothetical protein